MKNLCIKTGCTALIAGGVWHGDLFEFGEHYLLNCNSGPDHSFEETDEARINLVCDTWAFAFQQQKVMLIKKTDVLWYEYDGRIQMLCAHG